MLMHQLIIDGAERHPQRDCFHWVNRDRGHDYAAAVESMRRAAAALAEVGVRPEDRVSIVAHNGLDYLDVMFGCFYLGAIAALVNVGLADDLEYYFSDHDPTAIVYTHDLEVAVRRAAPQAPSLRALICMDGPQGDALSLPDLLAGDLRVPSMARDVLAPAHLSYTSGTTGQPKGAVLCHEPTVTATRCIGERLQITQDDILFGPGALSSSSQLVSNLLPGLAVGAAINVMGHWTAETGYVAIRERGATVLAANPPVLQGYLEQALLEEARTPLRMSLSGGAPVPPSLSAGWSEQLGVPLVESYGQSELGGFVALGFPRLGVNPPGSRRVGRALPDKEVRILSQSGEELPIGRVGEIVLRGGYMWGYWGKPAKTAEALRDGWLWTGDLGSMDAEGFITMRGRRSELLDIGGVHWFPRDVEEVLCSLPSIESAALVGVASEQGTRPVAAVVTVDGAELDHDAAVDAARRSLPYDISALALVRVPEMPMTPTGKIAKATLRGEVARSL